MEPVHDSSSPVFIDLYHRLGTRPQLGFEYISLSDSHMRFTGLQIFGRFQVIFGTRTQGKLRARVAWLKSDLESSFPEGFSERSR